MRVKTTTFPLSIGYTIRLTRINRQTLIDLSFRGITYLTLAMAINSVFTGGQSIIEFIYTYVLPIYQDILNA